MCGSGENRNWFNQSLRLGRMTLSGVNILPSRIHKNLLQRPTIFLNAHENNPTKGSWDGVYYLRDPQGNVMAV